MALRFKTKEELIAEFGEENWRQQGKSTFFAERMDVVLGKYTTDPIITDFNFKAINEDSRGTFNIKGEGGPWTVRKWMLTEAPLPIGTPVACLADPIAITKCAELKEDMEVVIHSLHPDKKISYGIFKRSVVGERTKLVLCNNDKNFKGTGGETAKKAGYSYGWDIEDQVYLDHCNKNYFKLYAVSQKIVTEQISGYKSKELHIGATVRFIRKHEHFNAPQVYYTDHSHAIPKNLIIHGSFHWRENQGTVVAIHKEYYIVNYISEQNKPVQLGFKAEDIEVVSPVQSISHKPKTNNEKSSNNGIKVPRFIGTITSGKRVAGNSIQGRRIRATISIGHLSNAQINSYR